MTTITDFLAHDHRRCDERFADLEAAAQGKDWPRAGAAVTRFVATMERHFRWEEDVLFPELEAQSAGDPVRVMRQEHEAMRRLFRELIQASACMDGDSLTGVAETLLFYMQVHNSKEENILYPLADRLLSAGSGDIVERMRSTL